jgi:uncharacterized protein YbjT (DUF2867 family)
MQTKSALLIGASGLVGGHCLRELLATEYYAKVTALLRKPLEVVHEKLDHHFVDFDNLSKFAHLVKADDVFCTLGTTIRKAGSQAAFEKVDYTYPVEIAKTSLANGARQFLIVTAIGANENSPVFYNRVKGKVEQAISAFPFHAVHIFQPSFLIGERNESRAGEKVGIVVAKVLSPLLVGGLRKYRAIEAKAVARAMVVIASHEVSGIHRHHCDEIHRPHSF